MKISVISLVLFLLSYIQVFSQDDTLYMYKDGYLIIKRAVEDIDSIIFYKADLPEVGSMMDVDSNVYKTVIIGNQEWMAENLRTTKYANGHPIPRGLTDSQWTHTNQGAYSVYPHSNVSGIGSDSQMIEYYGLLYNWYATVNDGGLCPTGWRVPSNSDWLTLINYISYQNRNNMGDQLKSCRQVNSIWGVECATSQHPRWNSHHTHYGTDLYRFAGLPAGYRSNTGTYSSIGSYAYWWSTTQYDDMYVRYRRLASSQGNIHSGWLRRTSGYSVRCMRDI